MRKGMTLIEMIMAVALLAIMGIIVIQMFLSAQTMNQKSKELDVAVSYSVDAIEKMKSLDNGTPSIEMIQKDLFPESAIMEFEDKWEFIWLYDDKFQVILTDSIPKAFYQMRLMLERDPESNGKTGLITVTFERLQKRLGFSGEKEMLYTVTAGIPIVPGGEQP